VDGGFGREARWEGTPLTASAGQVDEGIKNLAVIAPGPSGLLADLIVSEQGSECVPQCVRDAPDGGQVGGWDIGGRHAEKARGTPPLSQSLRLSG
jgi:hypothetical protein